MPKGGGDAARVVARERDWNDGEMKHPCVSVPESADCDVGE